MLFLMEDDHGRAQGSGVARIKRRIPLLVLGTKTDHDQVGFVDQFAGTDTIDPRAQTVFPEAFFFCTQDIDAHLVAGFMVGDRAGEFDIQLQFGTPLNDSLAPIGVDLTGQIYSPKTHRSLPIAVIQGPLALAGGGRIEAAAAGCKRQLAPVIRLTFNACTIVRY